MAVNKVVYSGDTLMDISDTTATESSVVKGKTFYKANGAKVTGIAEYEPLIVKFNRTLTAASWSAYGDYFRQTVMGSQETNAKFDLQFDIAQLAQLAEDGVTAIVAINEDGTVYVYCMGAKPSASMPVQITKTLLY
jgi:hypothetical protein|nr:MAG TPA: tail protein [Caudoviricetes sp.]